MNGSKSYQVAVIGSGAGGRQAAFYAARNGLRVVLVHQSLTWFTSLQGRLILEI